MNTGKKFAPKRDYPVDKVRRFLEPGPVVLVSSKWQGEQNVMTMGWHMMLGYDLFGCYIWEENHSFELLRRSEECVINLPTADMVDTVTKIGNISGRDIDKFAKFNLTLARASKVDAPLIRECHANFECRLYDGSQIKKHGLFIWLVVKAHVATTPKQPQTLHYMGGGEFMVPGGIISRRRLFKPDYLDD